MKCLDCGMETSVLESPAWHCPKCKKILIWIDSKE